MKRLLVLLFELSSLSAFALGVKWEVETTNALPYEVKAFHGETFTLEAVVKERGSLLKGAATVTFYYQTPEMASHEWYTTGAQWSSESATCRLTFTPALDVGNDSYRFFFGIVTSQGANYRAYGTLRLKPSPGFNAATLEPIDIRDEFKKEILAEVLQSLETTFAPTEHAHEMDAIDGLQSALDGKADAFTVEQTLNESENPVSAKAVYQNLGNVVRNPDITDVIRYLDPNASHIIGNHHGKAIFAASNGDEGGFVVGGSYSSEPRWHQWTARFLWNKIRAYGDPEQYEDYLFTPGDDNQIARMKDVALKQDKLTAGENITIANGIISAAGGASGDEEPWVSPGDWHLTVRSSEDYNTVSTTTETRTNADKVIGETKVTAFSSSTKDVSVEMLDLASPTEPQPVAFRCEGVTLTPGPQGTSCSARADVEGLYRIFATDTQGRTRDAYLNLRAKTRTESVTNTYLADADGSARKAANDVMLAALATRNRQATVAVGQTSAVATGDKAFNGSTPLSTAPLAPQYFCMVEPKTTWGPDAVAVAPHFAVTAAHWQPSATKTATFVAPEGSVSTVSGTTGTSLTAWARANGYSESEIDEADIDDIYVWHFTSGTIPDACIPYVMDVKAVQAYYKGDLSGIMSYTVTQNGYLSYAPLTHADGDRFTFGSFAPTTTRADMLEHLAPACCATIYGGDSGRPILMIHDEKPVLLSTFWSAGSGPSFVKACDILDAYIKERSGGTEALKRIE